MVSVLFACQDSNYKELHGVDAWDIERDALKWPGGNPIVAHPPCRAWASLRHCAKPRPGEKEYALWAIEQVRKWGGVLEHPRRTTLWKVAGLPEVGAIDEHGGFTIVVDQFWWGHRAQKSTKLYICGCERRDLPQMPLKLGEAPCTVGLWSGRNKKTCRPSISKSEYEETPIEFAKWLVEVARRCSMPLRKVGT